MAHERDWAGGSDPVEAGLEPGVIEVHLRRIEAVDPDVNAVPVVLGERALEAADAADRAVALGGDLPRLHGVPFVVKSNIDVAGTPTAQDLRVFADAYPQMDAPIVERMKAVGRSRSAARTCRTSPCAGTAKASSTGRR